MAELTPEYIVALKAMLVSMAEENAKFIPYASEQGAKQIRSFFDGMTKALEMAEECLRLRKEREGQRVATKIAMDIADMCMADEDTMVLREKLAAAQARICESCPLEETEGGI